MKKNILIIYILVLLISLCSCEEEKETIINIDGLTLYWDHEVFGNEGRRLRFEFYGIKRFENNYELIFNYSVTDKIITIKLADIKDNGECPEFPTPNDLNSNCIPKGGLYIPDSLLSDGIYDFKIITSKFKINSILEITKEKITLAIPENKYFSSQINNVCPIPSNLLFGSIVFEGTENETFAHKFLDDLSSIGFEMTTIPDYSYNHLDVGQDGYPVNEYWPPDKHSLKFLYNMKVNFRASFELAKLHFNQSDENINIYLYSSNGDQARLNHTNGIYVEYAD